MNRQARGGVQERLCAGALAPLLCCCRRSAWGAPICRSRLPFPCDRCALLVCGCGGPQALTSGWRPQRSRPTASLLQLRRDETHRRYITMLSGVVARPSAR